MKIKKIFLILLALLMLSSCNNDNPDISQSKTTKKQKEITMKDKSLDEVKEDEVNKIIEKQDKLLKRSEVNTDLKGKDLLFFKSENIVEYVIEASKNKGLKDLKEISHEEKQKGKTFNKSFNKFMETFNNIKLKKQENIFSDLELKDKVNKDKKYIFFSFYVIEKSIAYQIELGIDENDNIIYKVNNQNRPSAMLGESGVYTAEKNTYSNMIKILGGKNE